MVGNLKKSVADEIPEIEELFESSETVQSKNVSFDIMDTMQNIKLTVVEMVSNVSNYLQNIFGFSKAGDISSEANGNDTRAIFMDTTLGASLMGLVAMVVMVVVLKRV